MEMFVIVRTWENQDGCGMTPCGVHDTREKAETEKAELEKEAEMAGSKDRFWIV